MDQSLADSTMASSSNDQSLKRPADDQLPPSDSTKRAKIEDGRLQDSPATEIQLAVVTDSVPPTLEEPLKTDSRDKVRGIAKVKAE
jgi:hypothetical protein